MSVTIKQGHVLDVLAGMAPESCHLAVTSPPYFRLRRYGCPPQVWPELDGRPPCAEGGHAWIVEETDADGNPLAWHCDRCGAWKGELGSEPLPELFVAHLVAVFRGVRRVLRRDGTCWINLSGSYLNNPGGQNGTSGHVSAKAISANGAAGRQDRTGALPRGYWLRPLNFVDTPGLLAHSLQADGWIWRADVALVKKSPLPESVQGWRWERCRVKVAPSRRAATGAYQDGAHEQSGGARNGADFDSAAEWADCPGCPKCEKTEGYVLRRGNGRPTRAWERLMVFAREPGAFWDSESVRERMADSSLGRLAQDVLAQEGSWRANGGGKTNGPMRAVGNPGTGRNLRDWQFWPTTGGVGGLEHYAAYPIALPSLAIRAGTPERGCCPKCSAPWARVVEREGPTKPNPHERKPGWVEQYSGGGQSGLRAVQMGSQWPVNTLSWRPTCACPQTAPPVPAVVLDCFGGSGSTAIAADRLGRDCVLVDLNADYARMAVRRVTRDAPLFADVALHAPATEPAQPRMQALPLALDGSGAGEAAAGEAEVPDLADLQRRGDAAHAFHQQLTRDAADEAAGE